MWEVPGARNMVRLTDGPKVEPRKQQYLDPEQARSFLKVVAGERLEAFWMVAIFGGLRIGELQGLRWQDVDLSNRQIRLAKSYLRPSRGLEPLRLPEQASLPAVRVHDLRHTYATLEPAAGVSPKVVQESLGHARISTTLDLYSHVIPAVRREAAEALERLLG
jgi:integrase